MRKSSTRSCGVEVLQSLRTDGFAIFPGPICAFSATELADSYDEAMTSATTDDLKIGSTTTRVSDLVNRGPAFDGIYLYPPLLAACAQVIREPFKLSSLIARTLHPARPAQRLHVDFAFDDQGWPMLGFIVPIDDFTPENGATLFLRGSQGLTLPPPDHELVPACAAAGSMIIFNGSIWHGHGPNTTPKPRRSIQGAYIRRTENSACDFSDRMRPETLARLSPPAHYLLNLH